jgi:hypothetical protein
MSLIIPGVQISVIRELVPKPLGGTGILGIVGCTEKDRSKEPLRACATIQEFVQFYGRGSAMAIPEVKAAFAAGLNQVVVAVIPDGYGDAAQTTANVMVNGDTPAQVEFSARARGAWGNKIALRLVARSAAAGDETVELQVFYDGAQVETFRNLGSRRTSDRFWLNVLQTESDFIMAKLPTAAAVAVDAKVVPANTDPNVAYTLLKGGTDPLPSAYEEALAKLENYDEVDMVTVSHLMNEVDATTTYAAVLAHCERMSRIAKPRLGFGQVPPAAGAPDLEQAKRMGARLPSDRFILVAPNGYLGAVIGMVAGLKYFESPTFKTLPGVASLNFDFSDSDLNALLQNGVCAVDMVPRKGIACVKGITTTQEQINVTRVADRAVRTVQNIAQDFIGLLNTEAQRLSLKQRIIEAFTAMEKEGALVPSTDGKSPAFAVTVESSPADFAQGIVRVSTAVRPVRAINFIYATILVQAF